LFDTRKGVESSDKKKFVKLIADQKRILGESFNKEEEEIKIIELENKANLYKLKYDEAKMLYKYADKKDKAIIKKDVDKYKNKFYYYKNALSNAKKSFEKKIKANENLEVYTAKHELIKEIIAETRSGEEISLIEQEEILEAIRRQKEEAEIPYYTWRFVCDKIDNDTAQMIEKTLEENLNKGSGINGEEGYINVTAFQMTKSYEFFVDYPKNSNLFRAFKKKGIQSYATHLAGKNSYDQENYKGGTAILIGNEGNGLRDEVSEAADIWVKIPMLGQVESLNAAIAASVMMFEVARQRRN
jgi:tRNA(Leu) C34 or U34 (ribose-2'-O)-methylase TrmL